MQSMLLPVLLMISHVEATIMSAKIEAESVNSVHREPRKFYYHSKKQRTPQEQELFNEYEEQRGERMHILEEEIARKKTHKRRKQKHQHKQLQDKGEIQRQLENQTARRDSRGCSLCYDGSSIPDPFIESASFPGWTCGNLDEYTQTALGGPGELECLEYQTVGKTECGCPTSPLDRDYCPLCDSGGQQLIPDSYLELPIPATDTQPVQGLTCRDLVFMKQDFPPIPCSALYMYKRYCGCPMSVPTIPPPAAAPSHSPTEGSLIKQGFNPALEEPDEDGENQGVSGQDNNSNNNGQPAITDSDISVCRLCPPQNPNTGDDGDVAPTGGSGFTCQLCPDKNPPQFGDRTLPYLTSAPGPQSNTLPYNIQDPNAITTCGVLADEAESGAMDDAEVCYSYVFPPVPVDVPAYCGCSGTQPYDLCSLCPAGQALVNPGLVVPSTGGMTCSMLQDYLGFITNEDACVAIAESASELCCTPLPDCPLCGNPSFTNYNQNKLYPPFGLTCSQLNLALSPAIDIDITCPEIQQRFGFYCGCPNAIRSGCSICAGNEDPPDPSLPIPALGPGITCGEVNEYASLRPMDSCMDDVASWTVDVRAFCNCPGFAARKTCSVQCRSGLALNRDASVPDIMGISADGSDTVTCGELADFAEFVDGSSLCAAIQNSIYSGCCGSGAGSSSAVKAQEADDESTADDANNRLFEHDDPYPPVLEDSVALDSVVPENVYHREFIKSPYTGKYHHASSSPTAFAGWNNCAPWGSGPMLAAMLVSFIGLIRNA